MGFTTKLGLHSQATRLFESTSCGNQAGSDGVLTLSDAPFQETWVPPAAEDTSIDYNSPKGDLQVGLLPVRSPLLGQSLLVSFPPLIDRLFNQEGWMSTPVPLAKHSINLAPMSSPQCKHRFLSQATS